MHPPRAVTLKLERWSFKYLAVVQFSASATRQPQRSQLRLCTGGWLKMVLIWNNFPVVFINCFKVVAMLHQTLNISAEISQKIEYVMYVMLCYYIFLIL